MDQRQCVILKGDRDWCLASSQALLSAFDHHALIFLSACSNSAYKSVSQKQAQQQLGKEFDAVIFDGLDDFNADSFGAIVGTIKVGGALIIFLPSVAPETLWLQRFNQLVSEYANYEQAFYSIEQGEDLPRLSSPRRTLTSLEASPTRDQQLALTAILKVVHGHRRRPLVLSSDRGRGKSAVLGMAAATLLQQGKKSIIVTAPSLATVDAVFQHAAHLLPYAVLSKGLLRHNDAEIRFIAPDALIESDKKADLLLIDEAAAIPVPMLEQLLDQFSRSVFATTLHGYEGTGLGFAIRFKKILVQHTPNWHSVKMTQAIRYLDNDILEAFSFKALLLDACPVDDALIQDCQPTNCVFEQVDRRQLAKDETSLSELFGLMVLAHYRTRPSDLQLMLDRDDVSIYVMRYQGHIVASAWLVHEGDLDDDLASAVFNGTRRLKGHLLPQSLLAHIGISSAGALRYQRIIRIAVHPAIQQRGIGNNILNNIIQQAQKTECDIIGTSFSVSENLLKFWSKSGFIPLRLGLQKDDVSSSRSMMMLMPLSEKGIVLVNQGFKRFSEQWPFLLQQHFQLLQPELVVTISQLLDVTTGDIAKEQLQELTAFAFEQRNFEVCQFSLWRVISLWIAQPVFLRLSKQQQALCVMLLLQQRSINDVVKDLDLTGKTQVIKVLRQSIAILLH